MRLVAKAGDAFKVERATAMLWKGHLRRLEFLRFDMDLAFLQRHGHLHFSMWKSYH
jgi:hypothetical protein